LVFGMPGPELMEEFEAGRFALGGCVIEEKIPRWACTGPEQHRWSDPDGEVAG
jgi:hypothetical protein